MLYHHSHETNAEWLIALQVVADSRSAQENDPFDVKLDRYGTV
jgi:hypothetical protein